jgi:hypothetical protein
MMPNGYYPVCQQGAGEEDAGMGIVGRIEASGRKLAVVDGVEIGYGENLAKGFQVRDVTHSESGDSGTIDGIGRVLGNPLASLEAAMRSAHETLFGVALLVPAPKPREREPEGYSYHEGNERSVGAGPEDGEGSR